VVVYPLFPPKSLSPASACLCNFWEISSLESQTKCQGNCQSNNAGRHVHSETGGRTRFRWACTASLTGRLLFHGDVGYVIRFALVAFERSGGRGELELGAVVQRVTSIADGDDLHAAKLTVGCVAGEGQLLNAQSSRGAAPRLSYHRRGANRCGSPQSRFWGLRRMDTGSGSIL